ncbi:flagellar biosynthetic protein FliR [Sulfobacillus harzensis]|uniref:Flagellar biosynthetic protein FliR n=1 Tax=Sulfobacillus harzensis TaxID=2729629 RepID=A0A7Y0L4R8_9FIRM|nr:flagellar biosynthetic protein FliR [Sulfobacillus harzensis]NMP23068.1 flagellar biosynthetic protein FliR [Sulfobacillus harzensis]
MTLALDLTEATVTFLLVAARIAGIIVTAPLFSSSYIPAMLRVAMVFVLALILTPGLHADASMTGVALSIGILVQFVVGTMMGLVLALFLSLFGMAGQVITYQLGVGLAVAANPGLLSEGSFLAEWETLLALFVFIVGGGPELMIVALHSSFQAISINALVIPGASFGFVTGLFQTVLEIALLMAAPLVMTGLIVNLAVGVLSRAFPQLNAYFFSLPINFGLSLLMFVIILPTMLAVMPTIWQHAWTDVSRLLVYLEGHA